MSMNWTDAQKEFLDAEESTLFIGSRQIGKTEAAIEKAKRLFDEGKDVMMIVTSENHSHRISQSMSGKYKNINIACRERMIGHRGGVYVIDDYGACDEEVQRLRGEIYATSMIYKQDTGQFTNCISEMGTGELWKYKPRSLDVPHTGISYRGHSLNLMKHSDGRINAACTICHNDYSIHKDRNYVEAMALFYDPCPYRKI